MLTDAHLCMYTHSSTVLQVLCTEYYMPSKMKPASFLTVDDAHEIVGKDKISRRSFYNAIKRKEVPSVRWGRRILIPRQAFLRSLEAAGAAA
jgi:excisionase family DNA binding protein